MRIRVAVLVTFLLVSAGLMARADRYEAIPPRSSFESFPTQIGAWRGRDQPPFTTAVLAVLRVDDYILRGYARPGDPPVGLYIGYWRSQRQGDTIHSPLNCLPGAGWEPLSNHPIAIPNPAAPANTTTLINRYVIQKGMDRQLVLYWYQSHGRIVASEYWSRFFLVTDAMRLNRTDGAIVRVIAPIDVENPDGEKRAEHAALGFIKDLLPQLSGFLPA